MKVKLLSRLFSLLIVAIMLISCTNSVFAAAPKVDELLKLANEEGILVKAICAMPKAYDDPAKVQKLMDFYAGEIMLKQLPDYQSGKLDAATFKDSLEKLAVMRKEIKQIADPESLKIKIWPEGKMPVIVPYTSDPVGMYWDRPGFEPYIVPYLLDGNVNPKGAVIICPGGGFFVRTEPAEGDYYAKYFNSKVIRLLYCIIG